MERERERETEVVKSYAHVLHLYNRTLNSTGQEEEEEDEEELLFVKSFIKKENKVKMQRLLQWKYLLHIEKFTIRK